MRICKNLIVIDSRMCNMIAIILLILSIAIELSVSLSQCSLTYGDVSVSDSNLIAPEIFFASFQTDVTLSEDSSNRIAPPIVIQVNRAWAPIGVDRFYQLLLDNYYVNATFFRVVPDFIVQFGIAADPAESKKWNIPILDDPVTQSNLPWTVSYATAGENTRTTQLFINYINNSRLDSQGFAPFGVVVSGFETALAILNPTPGSSDGCRQELYMLEGNSYIYSHYPNISTIKCASITPFSASNDTNNSNNSNDSDDSNEITNFVVKYLYYILIGVAVIFLLTLGNIIYKRNIRKKKPVLDLKEPFLDDYQEREWKLERPAEYA